MLIITNRITDLKYEQLMYVYGQSNLERGAKHYGRHKPSEQKFLAEQDLYAYLSDVMNDGLATVAVWEIGGVYVSALRLEQYRDGLLLTSLETACSARGKGYAGMLVRNVLDVQDGQMIYSHIYKENTVSIHIHEKCGFRRIEDTAVLLDGSVSHDHFTYCYQK